MEKLYLKPLTPIYVFDEKARHWHIFKEEILDKEENEDDKHEEIELRAGPNKVELHTPFPFFSAVVDKVTWPSRVFVKTPQQAREIAAQLVKYAKMAEALGKGEAQPVASLPAPFVCDGSCAGNELGDCSHPQAQPRTRRAPNETHR